MKNVSLNSLSPDIMAIGRTSTPGCSMGQSKKLMPLCFDDVKSVRHRTKIQLALMPAEVQIFWPLMTHSSPSSSALHIRAAKSLPAFGSL